jgi:hypothetical protein
MLNSNVGSDVEADGKNYVLTRQGASGHAVFGPYEQRVAGRYVAEFTLSLADGQQGHGDEVCTILDVSAEFGNLVIFQYKITPSRISRRPVVIGVEFVLDEARVLDYRVYCTGKVPFLIEDSCRVVQLADGNSDSTVFDMHHVMPRIDGIGRKINLSSDEDTVESRNVSIYRRRDIEAFIQSMTAKGFVVSPVDWTLGEGFAETVVDLPPFGQGEPHIRLRAAGYDVT